MTWFSRHLNWTALFITIGCSVISHYVIKTFLRISGIPYWGPVFSPNTIEVILPAYSSFYLDAVFILTSLLSLIGFRWIITRKNRHWCFLLCFLVFPIVDLPLFISYIIEVPIVIVDISLVFRSLAIIIWLVGWIMLVSLMNKSTT